MTSAQSIRLEVVYDLVSEVYGDINSPSMLTNFAKQRDLVNKELESAMKILRDIAVNEEATENAC